MLFVPSLVPLTLYQLQPVSSYVIDFWQQLEGSMPPIKNMRFLGDAIILSYSDNRTVLSVIVSLEGFHVKADATTARFMAIGCVVDFILLDEHAERREFPHLLDISLPPFDSALNLCVSAARGHLFPRFHGTRWSNFVLPFIDMRLFRQAMKERDLHTQRTENTSPPESTTASGLAGETIKPTDDLT